MKNVNLKNTLTIWMAAGVVLVITLAYVKWEMGRTRKELAKQADRISTETPGKMAQQAVDSIARLGTTNKPALPGAPAVPVPGQPAPAAPGQQDVISTVFGAAKTGVERAAQVLAPGAAVPSAPGGAPAAPGSASTPNPSQDPVGAALDLAARAGRTVDQAGLRMTAMSDEEEMKVGEQMNMEILRQMPSASDSATLKRLEDLARPLVEQCERKGIRYTYHIVKSSKLNAFSCAGGHIYFTTTFLSRFTADEELAMTLGHEIAHVDRKHAVQKVQYVARARKMVGNLANVGQIAYAVLSSPYTKDQEFEADAIGFDNCRTAGWEAEKLLKLYEEFVRMEKESQAKAATAGAPADTEVERKLGDYFSSHPDIAERLERLKARCKSA